MDQSLSGGSGNPSRMTLTLICSLRESSDMRENYNTHRDQMTWATSLAPTSSIDLQSPQ